MKTYLLAVPLAVPLAVLAACNGPCEERSRTPVSEEWLEARSVRSRSGPLQWIAGEQYGFPPPGDAEITMTIDMLEAWNVVFGHHSSRLFPERLICQPATEVEVEIDLRSSDGALEATVTAPAYFGHGELSTMWVDVTEEDLGFAWGPVGDARLFLVLDYDYERAANGSLQLSIDGDETTIATWTLPTYERERP